MTITLFVLLVVISIIYSISMVPAAGGDPHSDSIDHTRRSYRVDVESLPGIDLTKEQLKNEEHWTGFLPVDWDQRHTTNDHDSDGTDQRIYHHYHPSHSYNGPALFYWLIKSRSNHLEDPLVIWLNGGPGCSSCVALLEEHGPFILESSKVGSNLAYHLRYNPYSWSNYANILYIDQPIGTGFSNISLNSHAHRLVSTQGEIARDLYSAITYFLLYHHAEYVHRRLHLTGESYAGKYIPSTAAYIIGQNRCYQKQQEDKKDETENNNNHHHDDEDSLPESFSLYNATFHSLSLSMSCHSSRPAPLYINLHSLLIGNGIYSPLLQRFAFRPVALSLGLMDVKQANQYSEVESRCMAKLRRATYIADEPKLFSEASDTCGQLNNAVEAFSSQISTSDLRRYTPTFNRTLYKQFLNHPYTRSALSLTDDIAYIENDCNQEVHHALKADTMRGVRGLLPFLLSYLPITLYTGNFDLKDGTWANEVLLDSLWDWQDRNHWFISRRYVWRPLVSLEANKEYQQQTTDRLQYHTSFQSSSTGDKDIYGYSKSYKNLSFVVVTQAGHMVASSQPEKANDLFYRFIKEIPYYNTHEKKQNEDDAERICKVLQCQEGGHGSCNRETADCQCEVGYTGTSCTIPVHTITDDLFRSSLGSKSITLDTYKHSTTLKSQQLDMFYFMLQKEHLEGLNAATTIAANHDDDNNNNDDQLHHIHPHYLYDDRAAFDNVLSSCTFNPPLLVSLIVKESNIEYLLSRGIENHLSLSMYWSSSFHSNDSDSAIRFLGDFEGSNLFYGSHLRTAAQWIAPRLLATISSTTGIQPLHILINRCDHYAIKIINEAGVAKPITYTLKLSIHEVDINIDKPIPSILSSIGLLSLSLSSTSSSAYLGWTLFLCVTILLLAHIYWIHWYSNESSYSTINDSESIPLLRKH